MPHIYTYRSNYIVEADSVAEFSAYIFLVGGLGILGPPSPNHFALLGYRRYALDPFRVSGLNCTIQHPGENPSILVSEHDDQKGNLNYPIKRLKVSTPILNVTPERALAFLGYRCTLVAMCPGLGITLLFGRFLDVILIGWVVLLGVMTVS